MRTLAKTTENDALPLNSDESKLLSQYVELFNAREFDAVRAMLADDVRLDLVEAMKVQGVADVGKYFGNYNKLDDWLFTPGYLERKPAILVSALNTPSEPEYLILLEWKQGQVVSIRDYRYVPLILQDAEFSVPDDGESEETSRRKC